MNANQLIIGAVLQSATESKVTRTIEDFRPAEGRPYRQWLVNGQWLNYAEVEARFKMWKAKKPRATATPAP